MSAKIVVVGSANIDLIAKAPRLPRPGETILGGKFTTAPGGKGANQAVAAAKLGAEVWFVGCIGKDDFANELLAAFNSAGIYKTFIRQDMHEPTGVGLICVDEAGENAIVVSSGANMKVSENDVSKAAPIIHSADALILQLEIPNHVSELAMNLAIASDVPVILNPAPVPQSSLPLSFITLPNVLTPNELEAAAMAETSIQDVRSAKHACSKLLELGARAIVLTLGPEGAIIADGKNMAHIPGFPITAIDSTAAGDAFTGALALQLAKGADLHYATKFACAAGALTCTKMGAQPSLPKPTEVNALLRGG